PDLVYVDDARLDRLSDRGVEGAPTLVIEILSPSTAAADRGRKRQISEQYGVPHYWIVDPDSQLIETYQLSGTAYEPGPRLHATAPAALPPFPDLQLDPVDVWR